MTSSGRDKQNRDCPPARPKAGRRRGLPLWILSCGGLGLVPGVPGTYGTLAGVAAVLLTGERVIAQVALLAVAVVLGLWLIPVVQRDLGRNDPPQVVLDEVAGALVTFLGLPLTPPVLLAGFVAFRFLDIVKPPPIRRLERLPGAAGVLADDLAAGLVANLLLRLLI